MRRPSAAQKSIALISDAAIVYLFGHFTQTIRRKVLESKSRELGPLQVAVEGSNLGRAINQLKRHMAREGVMKELKRRRHYEKPSIIRKRKQKEAARRRRKEARRRARFV